jgi:hypothetical protein
MILFQLFAARVDDPVAKLPIFIDTGSAPRLANISANFPKFAMTLMLFSGA